mmetsp:Transcript_13764/g.27846  ORF Transcript_13764/g.27846 Transcript_13764/m.27846 type:complete len:494 (-) Transcript_13764:133-1614(-)
MDPFLTSPTPVMNSTIMNSDLSPSKLASSLNTGLEPAKDNPFSIFSGDELLSTMTKGEPSASTNASTPSQIGPSGASVDFNVTPKTGPTTVPQGAVIPDNSTTVPQVPTAAVPQPITKPDTGVDFFDRVMFKTNNRMEKATSAPTLLVGSSSIEVPSAEPAPNPTASLNLNNLSAQLNNPLNPPANTLNANLSANPTTNAVTPTGSGALANFPIQIPSGAPFAASFTQPALGGDSKASTITNLNVDFKKQLMQHTQQIIHESLASAPGNFSSLASAPASLGEIRELLTAPNTESRMSTRTTFSSTKRKKKALTPKDIALRRAKHKKVENRRRKRISTLFTKLSQACGCLGADKASILQNALTRIEMGMNSVPASTPQVPQANAPQSAEDINMVNKPMTLLDSKRMLFLSNFTFKKAFKVEDEGYVNVFTFLQRSDVMNLQKHLVQCQKGQSKAFYLDVTVNIQGEFKIVRMYTSMLVSRWHFVTVWSTTPNQS